MATEPHYSWKIAVLVAGALLATLLALGWGIAPSKEDVCFTYAILVLCMAIGWTIGMMLSPDSKYEKRKFLSLWKGVSLFASGYFVSKIDPLVESLLSPEVILGSGDHLLAFRLIAGLATVILSSLLTYLLRVYAFTIGED